MNARSHFSSEQPGRFAAYAVDNSTGTWWEPNPDDAQPQLTIDLGPATRFDVTQLFTIDSVRLLFTGGRGFGRRRTEPPGSAPPVVPAASTSTAAANTLPAPAATDAFQYRLEVSVDGETFATVLDRSGSATPRNTIFEEFAPTQCRLVRLTLVNWPRVTPLGLIELTIFGKPTGLLPASQPISYKP
jgi:hypothetical protein